MTWGKTDIVTAPTSISPLPPTLKHGLTTVAICGLVSFISCSILLVHLVYRLFRHRHPKHHHNALYILILNLIFADAIQATAFGLSLQWLFTSSITTSVPACTAQGILVSIGDLASGLFTLAIAFTTTVDVIFTYRPSLVTIMIAITALWSLTLALCAIGPITYVHNPIPFYARAGAWCWISSPYPSSRLWLHYFWIFASELAVIVLYSILATVLLYRLRNRYYHLGTHEEKRAKLALKSAVLYPIVYVACSLPLAVSRMQGMTSSEPGFAQLTAAGAAIASTGFLDVVLYVSTRRALLFDSKPPATALETFGRTAPLVMRMGTTTKISGPERRTAGRWGWWTNRRTESATEKEMGIFVHTEVSVTYETVEGWTSGVDVEMSRLVHQDMLRPDLLLTEELHGRSESLTTEGDERSIVGKA